MVGLTGPSFGRFPRGRIAAALAALALAAAPARAQDLPEPAQNALAGSRVFGEAGCASCHPVRGLGARRAPDLGATTESRSLEELAAALWNHLAHAELPDTAGARARMSGREMGDLGAFLFTIDYFEPPGDPARGHQLFLQKRCVMCHQVAGVGGVVGPSLDFLTQFGSPITVAAAMWNHGPAMADTMAARGIQRPSFTSAELLDLISFLESSSGAAQGGAMYVMPGRASRGRELFQEKSCVRCHRVGGVGGTVGPALTGRAVHWSPIDLGTAMWNKEPKMQAAMRRHGVEVPNLDGAEMADIVAYLYSIRFLAGFGDPGRGRTLLSAKGCLGCHALDGRGGGTAGDLAAGPVYPTQAAAIAALWNHVTVARNLGAGAGTWSTLSPSEAGAIVAWLMRERPVR